MNFSKLHSKDGTLYQIRLIINYNDENLIKKTQMKEEKAPA